MSDIRTQGEDFANIKDLAALFVRRWYWFALSVIVCLGAACIYIAVTPPTYTRSASILIKNNKSNAATGIDPLAEMGLFKQTTDAQSEVYVLRSPQLMASVINRLRLHYNYRIKYKGVRKVDLYYQTPVTVCLDSVLERTVIRFEITIRDSGSLYLSEFNLNDQEMDYRVTGKLSVPIATPFGVITVDSTAIYSPSSVGKKIIFEKWELNSLAKSFSKRLSISTPEENVPIIELSYTDVNAQRAEDLLNFLIRVYNENWVKDKNLITSSTSEFINDRLRIIEGELGHVDQNISAFKSENLLPDVKAVSTMYLSQYESNTSKLALLGNQLAMARYIQEYICAAAYKDQLIPANTGIENRVIEAQIEKYNAILLQKNTLLANSSEQNPVVADMIKSLEALKGLIVGSVDDYLSTLRIQLNNIGQEEKRTNQKIASNPDQAKYLLSVERQQKVKEALYLFLLQKREENELSQTFTAYNTKVINLPNGEERPNAPRKRTLLLIALIIGLVLPAVLLFILENLDTLVRGRSDLGSLGIPFIGEIPTVEGEQKRRFSRIAAKNRQDEKVRIVVAAQKRNVINEAFRNIRNNIDFMRPKGEKSAVIMTTSMFPGSGKTFLTSNIALSMAVKGSRSVMVDLDLRKATLSKLVDSPQRGLSDYLAGNLDTIGQITLQSGFHPDLDIIPAGKVPPNPSELILGEKFGEFITLLRARYDYIFLDCPPVEIVSETAIIGGVCDMTLFVVRAGIFDKRMLPLIEEIYLKGQFRHMGILLNGTEHASRKYGYGKYGYGNGYGSDDE